MAAPPSQPNIVMCSPEIDIRCATPVLRNTSQPGPSIAAWSPTASAASAPVAAASPAPSRPLSIRRSRTHWRAFSIGAHDVSSNWPLPRTVPVARKSWSNSHSSASKPSGFIAPCGRRRRTGRRQRWPARNGAGAAATARSSRWLRLHASQTRDGTIGATPGAAVTVLASSSSASDPSAGCPTRPAASTVSATAASSGRPAAASSDFTRFNSRAVIPSARADSTTNAKCSPSSATCGISAITPTSSMSQPSHSGASASARRTSARQPANANPAIATASPTPARATDRQRTRRPTSNPHKAAAPSKRYTAPGHDAGCRNCNATPATQASAVAARHHAPAASASGIALGSAMARS